jgi:hypothetical protein
MGNPMLFLKAIQSPLKLWCVMNSWLLAWGFYQATSHSCLRSDL